jgi:hypothetical protein
VAPLPQALGQGTTAAGGGKVYVAGGFIGGTSVTNAFRIYDIATNTWSSGPNLPTAVGVEAAAGAFVNGKFYVMGGDDFNNGLNTTYIYTVATNSWTTGATLPDFRTNTYATVASNGMIYLYGGVILPAFTTTDTLLRYDPVANTWTNLGSAGTAGARGNYGAISPLSANQLLITDGANASGVSTTATHIFTISSGTFSAGPAMLGARAGHAQGTLPDGRILVADGFNTATTTTSTVELLTGGGACPTPSVVPSPTRTPTPTPTTSPTVVPSPSCSPGTNVTLYDQNNNPGTISTNSQDFETANNAFDDFLADDFVVPAGQTWTITEVDATGVYFNGTGPAASFNVFFHSNSGTLPLDPALFTRTAQTFVNAAGVFQVNISPAVVLPAGTYWVSVQARQDFTPAGQWGWTDRTVQSNNPAAWKNPGGGFPTPSPGGTPQPCINWRTRQVCTGSPAGEPDQMFRLIGSTGGTCPTPSPGITPTPSASPSPTSCATGYTRTTGTGATIVPGTALVPGSQCDDCVNPVSIPFSFSFYGQPFTSVNASSNGNLQFSSTDVTWTNTCLPAAIFNYSILPHWDDMLLTGATDGIFTSVSGSAPNRILNIEWRGPYFSGGGTANFEARLYETSNQIDFVYGVVTQGGSSATVGLQRDTGSVFDQFACNTAGTITSGLRVTYVPSGACATPSPTIAPSPTRTPTPTPSPTGTPPATTMQFSSPTYREDESQVAVITVTRTLNDGPGITSTVNYATSNGTATGGAACTANIDYISAAGTLTFNPGETSKTFNVSLCPDSLVEANETVNLTLSNPTGGTIGTPGTAVLTINDTANDFRNTTCIDMTLGSAAAPYPSTITVSGGPQQIGGLRITLFDVWHQFPDNIDVLLVGPQGQKFILQGDAGGPVSIPQNAPVTLTFIDTAGQVLPNSTALTTGNFEPTNWETPVTSFPAPAPPAPYNEPGSTVGGTGLQTLNGNFFLANANGTWSLYVRDDAGTTDPNVVIGSICGWGIQFLQSTAAGVSLSGRVTTADGAGIRNARVTITGNSLPEPRVVTTGSFGYYSFDGLTAGETYVVTVNSQRYTFQVPSRVYTLIDNIVDADFTADQ